MIVAGVGCKRGSSTEAVLKAVAAALSRHALECSNLGALATSNRKATELGIHEAAAKLSVPLHAISDEALRDAQKGTLTHSSLSMAVSGVSSLSEAAALAAAGPRSRLLGPRLANENVTCALASDDGVLP